MKVESDQVDIAGILQMNGINTVGDVPKSVFKKDKNDEVKVRFIEDYYGQLLKMREWIEGNISDPKRGKWLKRCNVEIRNVLDEIKL